MLQRLAKSMARFFSVQNIIQSEYEEIYAYGAEILLSTVINCIIALIIALITDTFFPTMIFLTVFILIRRNAGGYHAKTHMGCTAILIFVQLFFSAVIIHMPNMVVPIFSYAVMLVSCISVYVLAPVEHPNKPLKNDEKVVLRKRSLMYVMVISVINIILIFAKYEEISLYISYGLLVAVAAMIAEKAIPAYKDAGEKL